MINPFALSGLLIGLSCTAMAVLVFFKNPSNAINRLWSIFCMVVSIWGFAGLSIGLTDDPNLALILWRTAYIGVVFVPSLFYHFVLVFLKLPQYKFRIVAYLLSIVFLMADATPLMIPDTTWM